MKNLFVSILLLFVVVFHSFAFSGGDGSEETPYLIANFNDWQEMLYQAASYSHYRLISDITIDPNTTGYVFQGSFNGFLHGGGHSFFLPESIDRSFLYLDWGFFSLLPPVRGHIDSIKTTGELSYMFAITAYLYNGGEISNCTNSANVVISEEFDSVGYAFFVNDNCGRIKNCINYGNITFENNVDSWNRLYAGGISSYNMQGEIIGCKNYGNITGFFASGGICAVNYGTIKNCTNYGDILSPQSVEFEYISIVAYPTGGIYAVTEMSEDENVVITVENCVNYGKVNSGKFFSGGGIGGGGTVASMSLNTNENIVNCANYGEIIGGKYLGGILGMASAKTSISSCYNAGRVNSATSSGGIVGLVHDSARIANCLDVSGKQVMIDTWDVSGDSVNNMSSNYYDFQMTNGLGEEIEGETEGRPTLQLTGDSPELRAMLGDGWSYAEGRYPIPLGLETDSLAMLFASPIFLRYESDDDYDNINLVREDFTLGTENNVIWSSAGGRLSINGGNATILSSGSEVVEASLAGYTFSRRLNLEHTVATEIHHQDDISIYPNPVSANFTIECSGLRTVEIYNVMGQVVGKVDVNADAVDIDSSQWKSGVYTLRITTADGDVAVGQFVKR